MKSLKLIAWSVAVLLLTAGGAYAKLWHRQSGGFQNLTPDDHIDTTPVLSG